MIPKNAEEGARLVTVATSSCRLFRCAGGVVTDPSVQLLLRHENFGISGAIDEKSSPMSSVSGAGKGTLGEARYFLCAPWVKLNSPSGQCAMRSHWVESSARKIHCRCWRRTVR